jgi:protein-disulfide isomerase
VSNWLNPIGQERLRSARMRTASGARSLAAWLSSNTQEGLHAARTRTASAAQSAATLLGSISQSLSQEKLVSRRNLIVGGSGAAVLAAAGLWYVLRPTNVDEKADPIVPPKEADQASTGADGVMAPGPLPALTLGKANAPITVVEYASMTCGHCANFHNKVFPQIKAKYIDTGMVYFVMREFPLDNLAAAASMLARCVGGEKTFPLISVLFAKQEEWAFVRGDPRPELLKIGKQVGFTQETFDKCLTDQKLLDNIVAIRTRAADTFGVTATPTFFINGKKMTSGPTLDEFDKAFGALLKN